MKSFFLSLLFVFSSSFTFAGEWSQAGAISSIYVKPSKDGIYFHHDYTVSICPFTKFYFLPSNQAMFEQTYAMLMHTYTNGGSVKFYVDDCQTDSYFPEISEIEFK